MFQPLNYQNFNQKYLNEIYSQTYPIIPIIYILNRNTMESTNTLYIDQLGKDKQKNYFNFIKTLRDNVGTVDRKGQTTYYVKEGKFDFDWQVPQFFQGKDKPPYQIQVILYNRTLYPRSIKVSDGTEKNYYMFTYDQNANLLEKKVFINNKPMDKKRLQNIQGNLNYKDMKYTYFNFLGVVIAEQLRFNIIDFQSGDKDKKEIIKDVQQTSTARELYYYLRDGAQPSRIYQNWEDKTNKPSIELRFNGVEIGLLKQHWNKK